MEMRVWLEAVLMVIVGIKFLCRVDEDIPAMTKKEMFLVAAAAMVLFTVQKQNILYALILFVISYLAAYTDYHTYYIYDIFSIAGILIGILINIETGTEHLQGLILMLLFLVVLMAASAMEIGDAGLLLAGYLLLNMIIRNEILTILVYFMLIILALLISMIVNWKKIRNDAGYRTYFGPYHMAVVLLFLFLYA